MSTTPSANIFPEIAFNTETPEDNQAIEALHDDAFGPGRFVRAASIIREQGGHDRGLSFTAKRHGDLTGSVRMTPIAIGAVAGHLLGPLAVLKQERKLGVGKHLVNLAVDAARRAGSPFVLLVGDAPYYWPMGFRQVSTDRVLMPLPVAPDRLLACELQAGIAATLVGNVCHVDRIAAVR